LPEQLVGVSSITYKGWVKLLSIFRYCSSELCGRLQRFYAEKVAALQTMQFFLEQEQCA